MDDTSSTAAPKVVSTPPLAIASWMLFEMACRLKICACSNAVESISTSVTAAVGTAVGCLVGEKVGIAVVGDMVGSPATGVGWTEGIILGLCVVGRAEGVKVVGKAEGATDAVTLSGRKKELMMTEPLLTLTTLILQIGMDSSNAMLATKVLPLKVSKSRESFIVTATEGILRTM